MTTELQTVQTNLGAKVLWIHKWVIWNVNCNKGDFYSFFFLALGLVLVWLCSSGPEQDITELIWLDYVLFIEVHCSKLSFYFLPTVDAPHPCLGLSGTRSTKTLFPLTYNFPPFLLLSSGHCFLSLPPSLSLRQLNFMIANHISPPAAYIMHYLLQLGLFF